MIFSGIENETTCFAHKMNSGEKYIRILTKYEQEVTFWTAFGVHMQKASVKLR
jgi:hypothetical protein